MGHNLILLIEDEPADAALVARALQKEGVEHELVVVRDGAEALDYLFAGGAWATRDPMDTPRVIFLDLKLPRVGGLEVLRRIRAEKRMRCVPVVILTSSDEPRDVDAGYRLGANSYVRKPVESGAFTTAIGQLALYWLSLNRSLPRVQDPPGAQGS